MEQPDRTPLTLAEVVSWIAWGCSFRRATFLHAFETALEQPSPRAAAALAELQTAAGGAEYGTSLEDQLTAAETVLFDAIIAGRLTCYAKLDERDEAWQSVPVVWFLPDIADPRPLRAALDRDWIAREGPTPLYQVIGPFARANPNGWKAVRFERGEVHAAFLPEAALRWPVSEPARVEAAPPANAVIPSHAQEMSERPQTSGPTGSPAKGGKGPTRQVSAAMAQLGAKLAAEGAPDPHDGGQARLERWFRGKVASLHGEISEGRARVHVRRAIKLYREEMAKDR